MVACMSRALNYCCVFILVCLFVNPSKCR
uniref:Uncharacterized protein n=1 Tax=Arundo donax TaxID=35708 RepID=A0A0A9CAQ9_ARUDO